MNNLLIYLSKTISVIFFLTIYLQGQTIEQRLVVVQNDKVIGGSFRVGVQVKGTDLPAANTIASATIDIQFNNTHLTYINSTNWAFGTGLGYNRFTSNLDTYIRVGVTGGGVNEDEDGIPPGFDIESTYTTWVQLNFTILEIVSTDFIINDITNAIGLFENHSNNPKTGVINDQLLTPPENIIGEPLPVELSSFTGKINANNSIDLNWMTKTEINNYGFNVERRINEEDWNSIGFVGGHGNSNSPKEYSFTDDDLFAGGSKFQYRLKQIDTDGQFEYSDVVEVELVPTKYELSQNYP
ncbi:MAG: hypothetical protein RBR74_01765, partial [Ignavibacteriaceae bacterium]|nr:hypothetical protein [Ignavibacteriaceae bacterium]